MATVDGLDVAALKQARRSVEEAREETQGD